DKTPGDIPGASRGTEIAAWLAEHPVSGYVIIDDHADMDGLRTHLVQTHPARGLEAAHVSQALALLMLPREDERSPSTPFAPTRTACDSGWLPSRHTPRASARCCPRR